MRSKSFIRETLKVLSILKSVSILVFFEIVLINHAKRIIVTEITSFLEEDSWQLNSKSLDSRSRKSLLYDIYYRNSLATSNVRNPVT